MIYWKVEDIKSLPRIFRQGYRPGMYVWKSLDAARGFAEDEVGEEEFDDVRHSFAIVKVKYSGKTSPDPCPDYPGVRGREARVLVSRVSPGNIELYSPFRPVGSFGHPVNTDTYFSTRRGSIVEGK